MIAEKKTFACKIGLHDYLYLGTVQKVFPSRGPFDPREDEDRTMTREHHICCQCGKEKFPREDYESIYM